MNIRVKRQLKGLSQKELADKLGISISTLSRYESGAVRPSSDKLSMIAEILDTTVDSLLGIESSRVALSEDDTMFVDIDKYVISKPDFIKRLTYYTQNCELCGNPAPFMAPDGSPYLEYHYVDWLSQGGKEEPSNTVLLCPNCHRRIHILNDPADLEALRKAGQTHTMD